MSDANSDKLIWESKLTLVNAKIMKCEKKFYLEKAKLDRARKAEKAAEVLIYEKSANQKHSEWMYYLWLRAEIEERIDFLERQRMEGEIMLQMNGPLGKFVKARG